MIGNILKHFLYDVALNIFFDAVNNNFYKSVNLIGKRAILTRYNDSIKYAILITEVNPNGYSENTITGILEDAWGVPDEEYIDDFGSEYNFDLEYFNMVLL